MKIKILLLLLLPFCSCKKYLDPKPDQSLVTPSSLSILQALLDNNSYVNMKSPSIGEASSDNYFLNTSDLNSLDPYQKNAYLWDTACYDEFPNDWALCYQPVYFSNIVLDNIATIEKTSQNQFSWNNVKGSALFFRARSFLTGIWNWGKAYDKETASTDLGIPLRMSEDFNEVSVRASVKESYNQIISDLQLAISLLPVTPLNKMRPSKPAAYAMLARAYLSMREYDSCFKYANLCLELTNNLIDYNELKWNLAYPVPRFNKEIVFQSRMGNFYYNLYLGKVDSLLYNSYSPNDLRIKVFFSPSGDGFFSYKGSYDNSLYPFDGIAIDEVYLMRAEAYVRSGNTAAAMNDLNTLLIKRWETGTFIPFAATSSNDALGQILAERRKELLWRGLRWMDIKRLNKENSNIILSRVIDGQTYRLSPNENRYALPLPNDVLALSGMLQNPR